MDWRRADLQVSAPADLWREMFAKDGEEVNNILNILEVQNSSAFQALKLCKACLGAFKGHSNFSVAIVQFLKGKLEVLCQRSDKAEIQQGWTFIFSNEGLKAFA